MDITFPTLYKRTEIMYLGEFEEDVVYTLTQDIYREELLKLFQLESFDANLLDEKVGELYEKIKDNEKLQQIIMILEEIYGDKIFSFAILFSYDYFYLFYPCIQDIINGTPPNFEELKNSIRSNT